MTSSPPPIPVKAGAGLAPSPNKGFVRRKIIKTIVPETTTTTTTPPSLIESEQNAMNRTEDDPRCEYLFKESSLCRRVDRLSLQFCHSSPSWPLRMTRAYPELETTAPVTVLLIVQSLAVQLQDHVPRVLAFAVYVSPLFLFPGRRPFLFNLWNQSHL